MGLSKLQKDEVDALIKGAVDGLMEKIKELKELLTDKDIQILNLREELKSLRAAPALNTSGGDGEGSWSKILTGKMKKNIEQFDMINVAAKENDERAKKEKNLIIFGLKDSEKPETADKKADDEAQIKQVVDALKLDNIKYEKVFRMNSRDSTRP